jgi:hypothetical protein
VSQWGIGHSGKGAVFFQNLARGSYNLYTLAKVQLAVRTMLLFPVKGVKHRNISVRIIYTSKFKKNSYHTPADLKKLSPEKVEIRLVVLKTMQ